MIINTGMRTDIPAFYSEWLINRIREGYVLVRNPYNPEQVTRYELTPDKVDIIEFCTKNPQPILKYMDELKRFRQFWFVTITPYGKDVEPNVPDKYAVMDAFRELSKAVGKNAVSLRYDPIFITDKYSLDYHIRAFTKMASYLRGYTSQIVISFIDLYEKTKRNFPSLREVSAEQRVEIGKAFVRIGEENGMIIRSCFEGTELAPYGVDVSGCLTQGVLESAAGVNLELPKQQNPRGCNCVLGHDIGMYNTCPHLCRYCYANYDAKTVMNNYRLHNPKSPFLIGEPKPDDKIHQAAQTSFITNQLRLF